MTPFLSEFVFDSGYALTYLTDVRIQSLMRYKMAQIAR